MSYSIKIFELVEDLNTAVNLLFRTSGLANEGISSRAVFGPILNEWNARQESPITQGFADFIAWFNTIDILGGISHIEVLSEYRRIEKIGNWETYNSDLVEWFYSRLTKISAPISIDVGAGNIQIFTAIRLLDDYIEDHPNNDPYSLKDYANNYSQLIYDLINTDLNPHTTTAFTVLMLEEGTEWYKAHAVDWNDYSVVEKEGLLVYYYKVGREFMNNKLDSPDDKIEFDIAGTEIIQEYFANRNQIGNAIRFYGNEVVEAVLPDEVSQPTIIVSDSEVIEGGYLEFVVSLTDGAVDHSISFVATTFQGSTSQFISGRSPDYYGFSQTYTIEAGESSLVIRVRTRDDQIPEDLEHAELHITNVEGASVVDHVGRGSIIDNDVPPTSTAAPEMQSVTLTNADAVTDSDDLRIDYTLVNSTNADMTGMDIKFYASRSSTFDINEATYLDHESGGTLTQGERDDEFETIQSAADLADGSWYLFSVADWDGQTEGVVLSTNQFTVTSSTPQKNETSVIPIMDDISDQFDFSDKGNNPVYSEHPFSDLRPEIFGVSKSSQVSHVSTCESLSGTSNFTMDFNFLFFDDIGIV